MSPCGNSLLHKYWRHLFVIGLLAVLWVIPAPTGLNDNAWHLFAIFLTTIVAIIVKIYPIAVIAFIGMTVCAMTGVLKAKEVLSSFGSGTIWLIVVAFFISKAFIKTGLGKRLANLFISKAGHTTLGLAYCTSATNLILGPFIPSNTARLGGLLYPLQLATALAYDSVPEKGTERRIGSFLMASAFYSNLIVSAMFITASAPNLLVASFAAEAGVPISWGTWALAASLPGLICLVLTPLIIYAVYPPELKRSEQAAAMASKTLEEMGPLTCDEKLMIAVLLLLLGLWTVGATLFKFNATMAAFTGLSLLLATGVLTWSDLAGERGAWSTLVWFSALIMMATYLNKLGFIAWANTHLTASMSGLSWEIALYLFVGAYFYSHYLFASTTAHVSAMYPMFLSAILAVGTPPMLGMLCLSFSNDLMSGLTHYGNGSAPLFYDSGYLPFKPFWSLGFLLCSIYLVLFMVIGRMWWSMLGLF